jgi:hydroxymethylglutaryl-CoA reductase (NADPH)
MSGTMGVHGHISNGLAALYLACGQDVACVAESSVGVTRMEVTEEGDLYAAVTLPSLMVGTVGGGTSLPTAGACLNILGLRGEGKAAAFAELCAAVVLAGELSIVGKKRALCARTRATRKREGDRAGREQEATNSSGAGAWGLVGQRWWTPRRAVPRCAKRHGGGVSRTACFDAEGARGE